MSGVSAPPHSEHSDYGGNLSIRTNRKEASMKWDRIEGNGEETKGNARRQRQRVIALPA